MQEKKTKKIYFFTKSFLAVAKGEEIDYNKSNKKEFICTKTRGILPCQ